MRKFYLALASCAALVAFMSLSATASAGVIEPECEADNSPAIHGFYLNTPTTNEPYEKSVVEAGGLVCGTDLTLAGGDETLTNHLDMEIARGVEVNDADNIQPVGRFISVAKVNAIIRVFGVPAHLPGVDAILKTAAKSECDWERANSIVGWTPQGETVLCWKSETPTMANYNWQTRTAGDDGVFGTDDDTLWNTVGKIHVNIGNGKGGLTKLDQQICLSYGGVVADPEYPRDCGTNPDEWNHKNGDPSVPNCENGNGIYRIRVTLESGATTEEVSDCVDWDPADVTPPNTTITSFSCVFGSVGPPRPVPTGGAAGLKIGCVSPWKPGLIEFESSEPNSTFECKVDRDEWSACNDNNEEGENGTTGSVDEGYVNYAAVRVIAFRKLNRKLGTYRNPNHTFAVRAIDEAGNTDRTPAEKRWNERGGASPRHDLHQGGVLIKKPQKRKTHGHHGRRE